MKICIDPGHGGNDPGCTGFGRNEKDLNLEYATILKNNFCCYENVTTIITRIDDSCPNLEARAKLANDEKCDLFISCHLNAYNSVARGTEIIHSVTASDSWHSICKSMGERIAQSLGISFRKAYYKTGNNGVDYYSVIRNTNMEAIIVEALFLDNKEDSNAYNPYKIADAISSIIAESNNLVEKVNNYKVVCGSFTDKSNADKRVAALKEKGFDSFII